MSMNEKRQYVRMNTVFPVEFQISPDGANRSLSVFFQGFTSNVSAGGMCLEFNVFENQVNPGYLEPGHDVALLINPVFSNVPINAQARVVWIRRQNEGFPAKYVMGIVYTKIDPKARRRIVGYARRLLWARRGAVLGGILALVVCAGFYGYNQTLVQRNRQLVTRLVESAQQKSSIAASLERFRERKESLDRELAAAHATIKGLGSKMAEEAVQTDEQKKRYEAERAESVAKQRAIIERLRQIGESARKLRMTYRDLDRAGRFAESSALRQMYGWLKSHQNLRTGLVSSYEGDPGLEESGFTYDQSLVCQTFLLFGDARDAEAILSFYDSRAQTREGAFFNAYNVADGSVAEPAVHTGPNVWLGIAALWHETRTRTGRFLPLARRIGDWVISQQDPEGGLKGGPGVAWYSTEHNLDAYAFLRMLGKVTGDLKYKEAEERVLAWITKYAYSLKDNRMNRGKGDATVATDTFSWAIAALGPAVLERSGLDPVAIMEFAEKHCGVTVDYAPSQGGAVKVSGFDFARSRNIGRGGIISTEWTAQMIVSYRMLAEYFGGRKEKDKADFFQRKADLYMNELRKLIITSPSRIGRGRGCLPYASADNADTGHGWRTPKGKQTGSVAGTAYGIFAWKGYNPFGPDTEAGPVKKRE